MSLNPKQQAAVEADGSVAVTAGAGTGKTHMLSARYLHLMEAGGLSPLELVAVTFTEKAATELRARIRKDAASRWPDRPELLAELEAASISTIHSLAARVCREHPEAAGVPGDFEVLDDRADGVIWLAERLDEALSAMPEATYAVLPYSLLRAALEALLADPLAAEAALSCPLPDPVALAREARREALANLLAAPEWSEAADAVLGGSGPADNAKEVQRAIAEGAVRALKAARRDGTDPRAASRDLLGLDLRVGGKKGWDPDVFEAVQLGLKTLKGMVKDRPLLLIEPGPADELLAVALPVLREAFASAGAHLEAAKREARYLTFSDLEVHALRALESEEVRAYYAERWKAYLIDEVQDTNPDQARLMERLVGGAGLTIVGDEKQSIYGFRRADVRVFRELRRRIGREVELEVSYRTHRTLVEATNRTFQSLLESPQALRARRERAPHPGPHLRLLALESGSKDDAEACRRAEARRLATELKRMLDAGLEVWDKDADAYRPLRFDDIALLCRTGRPLELYGEALAEAGIPSVLSGGGNLFQTREALDAIAMLRVLAEPGDSLALAAVLRSPFFAVSDPVLFAFAQTVGPRSWWAALKEARPPELERAYTVLEQLMAQPRRERPSRLLQLADQLTGYTAVIANLPGAERREADWGGFLEFLRAFEAGTQDVFHVVRRLKRHLDSEVAIERPLLKARDAVTLMTIHKSKGLEWPVVAIVNLSGKGAPDVTRIRFAPELGCALRFEDAEGNALEPVLFQLLKARKKQLEDAEERRVYYVGLTRGRDQVILSAPAPKGAALEFLLPGLAEAGVAPELVPFDPVAAGPAVLAPPRPLELPSRVLLGPVAQGLAEIPVTALAVYHRCGEQFRFQYVERHPGLAEGGTLAAKVGTLTHKALETGVRDTETLARYAPELPLEKVKEALELAIAFDTSPAFDALRQGIQSREEAFRLRHKGLVLRGVIDAVGPDFVLDYKTDREMEPEHHNLQLWAYAKVKGVTSAYLAYLRHGEVVEVRDEHLLQVESLATKLAEGIKQAKYEAQPGAHCAFCGFKELCRAGTDGASRHTASLG